MTEAATPKPFFTRRRVIVGTVVLFVIVGVAAIVGGVFAGNATPGVKVDFVRFDKFVDSDSTGAVVRLKNQTDKHFWINGNRNRKELYCLFEVENQKANPIWMFPNDLSNFGVVHFAAHSELTLISLLPTNGCTGRLKIYCQIQPRGSPTLQKLGRAFRQFVLRRKDHDIAFCDQWIQCPNVLPDGTVEPPRLLSAPGAKP